MAIGKKCFNCGKGSQHGHNVSHAKNRTNRVFEVNLHSAKIMVGSAMKRVRLCTKCVRRLKKPLVKKKVESVVSPQMSG